MSAALTLEPSAERPGVAHDEQAVLPGLLAQSKPATSLSFDGTMRAPEVGDDEPAEFDWMRDEAVIVEQQRSIAVYRNPRDAVVVRADGDGYADDAFIILSTDLALKAIIAALQREAKRGVR